MEVRPLRDDQVDRMEVEVRDVWSGPLLIVEDLTKSKNVAFSEIKILSSFERTRFSQKSVVAIAQRLHLFPFRTQKLSFVTPIVS